jgi:hypothetical protein
VPINWNLDFKMTPIVAAKAGVAGVTCFSDWIKGMPLPPQ